MSQKNKPKEYLNGINVSIKMEKGAKTPKIVSLEELENKYTVSTNNEFLLSLSKDKKELIINTDNYVKSITDTNCNYLWETERDRTVMHLEEERTLYELYDGYSLYLRIWKSDVVLSIHNIPLVKDTKGNVLWVSKKYKRKD